MHTAKLAGNLAFDPIEGTIWRSGIRIPLTPKAAAILSYLVERPGQLVSQPELLEAIWADVFIQPRGIKVYIYELRRALGDTARQPTHIETIPRRGYRLIGPLSHGQTRGPSGENEEANLPGRQTELRALDSHLDAARAGAMQIVFLSGECGIGKTALVEAFANAANSDVQVLRGRCLLTDAGREAYAPLLRALASLDAVKFGRLLALHAPTCALQMPAMFSAQQLAGLQAQTLHMSGARMLREVCELIEAISRTTLLLFILEDIHWADPAMLDFVNTIARRQHAEKLLLICTSLPPGLLPVGHLQQTLGRELAVKALCHYIELAPLSRDLVGALLTRELGAGNVTEGLLNNVVGTSGGNPLFIGSIVKRLKQGYSGGLQTAPGTVSLDISDDLKQDILARFAELLAEDRLLLEYASVAGVSFSGWLIAPLLDCTPEAADARYEALAEARGWIRVVTDPASSGSPESTRFEFIHGPSRDTIYGQIARARKAEIHRVLAMRIEKAQQQDVESEDSERPRHGGNGVA